MHKILKFRLANKAVTISTLLLVLYGSLMIVSAEMGNSVGDSDYLKSVIIKQVIFAILAIFCFFFFMNFRVFRLRMQFYYFGYAVLLAALLACRLFGQTNGAYAWIRIGNAITIQPSEFCKAFMIIFGAKMLSKDYGQDNYKHIKDYIVCVSIYFLIIFLIQNDLGSAIVFLCICACILFIPPYKEYYKVQKVLFYMILGAIALIFFVLSPVFTEFCKKHSDNYMFGRFLAAADPFLYRYDNGYHIIMSLVSFANGNIFGLGYGNSIHKYMNFPNPSNDFILPVIVEELGIVGFAALVLLYLTMLSPLIYYSFKSKTISSKIILMGTFVYFAVHFILNVGGVSGLIPLTGVPLLLISSGGSSLLASMICLGFSQAEIIKNKELNANNSGQV